MSDYNDDATTQKSIPTHFHRLPPIVDEYSTRTLDQQQHTIQECLPFLNGITNPSPNISYIGDFGQPYLTRDLHVDFAHDTLSGFPAAFVGIDASRPWFIYWALTTLYLLGENETAYRSRYVTQRDTCWCHS